jgi:hypothetical protein
VEALARKEPARRHRVFVVVERAVAEAWPGLSAAGARYAERHADRLELVAPPWIVEGGEAAKNDPALLLALQTVLHALRLDRQSFRAHRDACHMAVEFEDAAAGLAALRRAGIRVGKVQVSAGLRVRMDPTDQGLVDALRPFAEGVYLHQVVERRDSRLLRYLDLPEALA